MNAAPTKYELFASCAPGLSGLVVQELQGLDIPTEATIPAGVVFQGQMQTLYRANLWLGTASHVLVRLGKFRARQFTQFTRKLERIDFSPWLGATTVDVRVSSKRSRLYHTKAIAERVRKILGLKESEEGQNAPRIVVRFDNDECTVSFDSSGDPLHRRGYRLQTGKAPLRPDLAHALLLSSGWDKKSDLIDPFVGAGTVLIEAAKLAAGGAPGNQRSFAFMDCPNFDSEIWKGCARDAHSEVQMPRLIGCDRDAGVVEAAKDNADRAGVADLVRFERASISDCPSIAGGEQDKPIWVVSDPPYGGRTKSSKSLLPLYQRLGAVVRELSPSWHVALVAANRRLALATGLGLHSLLLTDRGGLKVRFFVGESE